MYQTGKDCPELVGGQNIPLRQISNLIACLMSKDLKF